MSQSFTFHILSNENQLVTGDRKTTHLDPTFEVNNNVGFLLINGILFQRARKSWKLKAEHTMVLLWRRTRRHAF